MDNKEKKRLEAVYRSLSDLELKRLAIQERAQFSADRIVLIDKECLERSLVLSPPDIPLSKPGRQIRHNVFAPLFVKRAKYILVFFGLILCGFMVVMLSELFGDQIAEFGFATFVLMQLYRMLCFDTARLRDAGLSGWLALLNLVPALNLALFILMFVMPTNRSRSPRPVHQR